MLMPLENCVNPGEFGEEFYSNGVRIRMSAGPTIL